MIARQATGLTLALIMGVAASSACAREQTATAPKEFDLGAHRVLVIVPTGWEALDQGKLKRFRKGELEIVLQNLGPSTSLGPGPRMPPPRDLDELVDRGLAEVGHDKRRDVKSRRAVTLDGREAMDIETWNRLDHTWPQRLVFVRADDDLLALHTTRVADDQIVKAFELLRDSLHLKPVGTMPAVR